MFVSQKCFVGISDIGRNYKATNRALLSYCENTGEIHSTKVGFGVLDASKHRKAWVLLNWKLKVIRRPYCGENITVTTWIKPSDKLYTYRDFEIKDEQNNVIALVTSKCVLIDLDKKHFVKIAEAENLIDGTYGAENKEAFPVDFPRFKEPQNPIKQMELEVTNDMIDNNNHVHNLNYINFAVRLLDLDIETKCDNLEVMYKKETVLGEKIKCFYAYQDGAHYVTIKTEDEKFIHSIVKIY